MADFRGENISLNPMRLLWDVCRVSKHKINDKTVMAIAGLDPPAYAGKIPNPSENLKTET